MASMPVIVALLDGHMQQQGPLIQLHDDTDAPPMSAILAVSRAEKLATAVAPSTVRGTSSGAAAAWSELRTSEASNSTSHAAIARAEPYRHGALRVTDLVAPAAAVTWPRSPSTVTSCPLVSDVVALPVPITAGMRYSRATMAAWDVGPPVSTTTAAACWNSDVHEGLV